MTLQLHFVKTGDKPSMLLVHPEHRILFDAPENVDPPFEPTAIFLTDRSEHMVKSVAAFGDVYGAPVYGAGKLITDDLEIEPFAVHVAKTKSYGYMIKSRGVNVAYVPVADDFPREVLGADAAIFGGKAALANAQFAKSAGVPRIYVLPDGQPNSLQDGQVLSLVVKQEPEQTKQESNYRSPTSEEEGLCRDCRFFVEGKPVEKGDINHPDVTENQIRVRVRAPTDFEPGSFRSISLDAGRGISAIIGKPRGQETTSTQSLRFDKDKWSPEEASKWAREHHSTSKSETGTCTRVIGAINPDYTCDIFEPTKLAPMTKATLFAKSVRQAFGSPGGKRAMARRILKMMPEHTVYVEAYAGGAAVFFAKDASNKEIINDYDPTIAQTYKDLQSVSDEEVRKIQRMDWTVSLNTFNRLKKRPGTGRISRLYTFLYKRGSAYGNYTQPSKSHEGKILKVAGRLPQVRERLQHVTIENRDALEVIKAYDSPSTFFYLDPPYPTEWKFDGNTGQANSNEWNGRDLFELLEVLKSIRGKFLLSLEHEVGEAVSKHAPNFIVKRIPMNRQMALGPTGKQSVEDEILVANYPFEVEKSQPDLGDAHVDGLLHSVQIQYLDDEEGVEQEDGSRTYLFAKSADSESKHLVWTVNMTPNKVDGEGHWQDEDTIMEAAHNFMLKDIPIWSEHEKAVKDVFPVQSYTLLADLKLSQPDGKERIVKKGAWVTVLWVKNNEEWAKVESGDYQGTSVRGFAKKNPGASPPPELRDEVQAPTAAAVA